MKRFIITISFISFILYGCISNQKIIHKEYEFERTYNKNHIYAFEIYLENLNSPRNISKLVNELIYNGKNFDKYKEYLEQKIIQETSKNDYPGINNEDGAVYAYRSEFSDNYSIVFHNDRFIIFENKTRFYGSGAAHGNHSINYYIIDLPEKKILDINDLLNQIPDNILEENIARKHNTNNLLQKNIWSPDTITFHNGAAQLIWNTYTILPYSEGTISIELKNEIVDQYLTKTGKELLLLTGKK